MTFTIDQDILETNLRDWFKRVGIVVTYADFESLVKTIRSSRNPESGVRNFMDVFKEHS